eukprot:1158918-Pelagomonas_calceolata.AAC.12
MPCDGCLEFNLETLRAAVVLPCENPCVASVHIQVARREARCKSCVRCQDGALSCGAALQYLCIAQCFCLHAGRKT